MRMPNALVISVRYEACLSRRRLLPRLVLEPQYLSLNHNASVGAPQGSHINTMKHGSTHRVTHDIVWHPQHRVAYQKPSDAGISKAFSCRSSMCLCAKSISQVFLYAKFAEDMPQVCAVGLYQVNVSVMGCGIMVHFHTCSCTYGHLYTCVSSTCRGGTGHQRQPVR